MHDQRWWIQKLCLHIINRFGCDFCTTFTEFSYIHRLCASVLVERNQDPRWAVILNVKFIVILYAAKGYCYNFERPYLDAYISSLLCQSQPLIFYCIIIGYSLIDVICWQNLVIDANKMEFHGLHGQIYLMQNLNQDYEDCPAFRRQLIIFGRLEYNVNLIFNRIKAGQNTSIRTNRTNRLLD